MEKTQIKENNIIARIGNLWQIMSSSAHFAANYANSMKWEKSWVIMA